MAPVTVAEIVDMQIALQLQGLGTDLPATGTWTREWAALYRLWLDANARHADD